MVDSQNISYTLLTRETIDDAVACICGAFLQNEPLTSHLKVTRAEFAPLAEDLVVHAVSANLSWIAMEHDTAKVVGARVITDAGNDFTPNRSYGERMDTILSLLNFVHAPLEPSLLAKKTRAIHGYMVAVDPTYQGAGIAKRLLSLSSSHALTLGYEIAIGEVTNAFNRAILAKIPSFEALHTVRYDEYTDNGRQPFKGLSTHEACVLFKFDLRDFSWSHM